MKQMRMKQLFTALAAALALTGAGIAHAATQTQNVTVSGTITPPPASCAFSGSQTSINISATAINGNIYSSPVSVAFTCTSGAAYSVSTSQEWIPITIGGQAAGAKIIKSAGGALFDTPATNTGNGTSQAFNIEVWLGSSAGSSLSATTHVGAVSGTLPLIVTY